MPSPLPPMPELEEAIRRSHERSRAYGVDRHLDGAPEAVKLSEEAFQERLASQADFYALAKEQIDTLHKLLKGTGFCMAIADREGYVLYVVGDPDFVEHFKRRRCLPRYRWTERDVGTCAIGLVLAERIPVFLPGKKMYSSLVQHIANAGAPVFSPSGELLGAVSLSGRSDRMHVHTLGLVRQAAETVTAHLRNREHSRELAIKNQYLNALIESDSRGIITVDPTGRILHANGKARELFGMRGQHVGGLLEDYMQGNFDIHVCLREGKGFTSREILSKKSGISHFASQDPIHLDTGELVGALLTVWEKKALMRFAAEVTGTRAHFTFEDILGESEAVRTAVHMAKVAAASSAPLLIRGETGTGKELFAQAAHNGGKRRKGPFVPINCAAIPKDLLESELFGYEDGAFTGAKRGGRPGKFEIADSGTLFLDEIGDMPLDMQVKLLRVLQDGGVQRIGGVRTIPVDLRIIAATNVDLKQAIRERKFREDLFFRISTFTITVPPLRERSEDIPILLAHFLKQHEEKLHRGIALPPASDLLALQRYPWPGNIRQLESAAERAVYLADGQPIRLEHFGLDEGERPQSVLSSSHKPARLRDIEARTVAEALRHCNGNICKAAAQLNISRPTLYRKIKRYGLEAEERKPKGAGM